MIIAIIPARKNSKRIKNKNIKLFNNKPMIKWTLSKLKNSKIFDKIIVSSDCNNILNIAKENGSNICIKRPKYLSKGAVTTKKVIEHSINYLKKKNFFPKLVFCVYPCTPFLNINDIKKSILFLRKDKNIFVSTITKYSHPVERSFCLKNNFRIYNQKKANIKKNTQKFKNTFYDCGQFYLASSATWLKKNHLKKHFGLEIPNWRAIDIDNIDDWKRAELLSKIINRIN